MGYTGHLNLKIKAQGLRRKGLSYSEVQKIIDVPRSTLSDWCRDIALTEGQALRLFKKKLTGSAKGRIIGAKRQQAKRLKQIEEMLLQGRKEVGKLSKRDKFVIGIALYAAEGTRGEKSAGFSNSDPRMVRFMMDWFRECCKLPEEKFRGAIWIHKGLNQDQAKEYWSKLTGISINKFHKTYVVDSKNASKKIRKNLHNYGVFSIRFSDLKVLRLVNGWIAGIFGDFMV